MAKSENEKTRDRTVYVQQHPSSFALSVRSINLFLTNVLVRYPSVVGDVVLVFRGGFLLLSPFFAHSLALFLFLFSVFTLSNVPFRISICAHSFHLAIFRVACVLCTISRMFVNTKMSSEPGLNRPRVHSLNYANEKNKTEPCNRNDEKNNNNNIQNNELCNSQ